MIKTAWIFPGQASQKVGMGKDLFENTKIGSEYFDLANEILNFDIKNIIFNGPDEELKKMAEIELIDLNVKKPEIDQLKEVIRRIQQELEEILKP